LIAVISPDYVLIGFLNSASPATYSHLLGAFRQGLASPNWLRIFRSIDRGWRCSLVLRQRFAYRCHRAW
jgi:hypothetical protein